MASWSPLAGTGSSPGVSTDTCWPNGHTNESAAALRMIHRTQDYMYVYWRIVKDTTQEQPNGSEAQGKVGGEAGGVAVCQCSF